MSAFKLFLGLSVLALTISGCAALEGLGSNVTPPTLIERTPFPKLPSNVTSNDFYLKMHLLISTDGMVKQASLENSSGDPLWDTLAIGCVLQWRYSPAMSDNKAIQMKIDQTAHVIYVPPIMMELSEIRLSNSESANQVYSDLKAGKSFDTLAVQYSIAPTKAKGGYLGKIDINRYPDDVIDALNDLKPGEFTAPLKLGVYTVIFLRAQKQTQPEALK